MNEKAQNFGAIIPQIQPLPICEPCWVFCEGYRCLAVWDRKGMWRSYATGIELPDFIKTCVA